MTNNENRALKYFVKGQEAHRAGIPKEANPYDELDGKCWDDGWDAEQLAAYGSSQ